jgi:hypothetical protein
MGIWDRFFGQFIGKKPHKSPYMPIKEDPIDISFAKNFTLKGGRFLFCESSDSVFNNYKEICVENKWNPSAILCLEKRLSINLDIKLFDQSLENLKSFKAAVIFCEYIISDSGKILLSEHQISHFKIPDLPETMVVFAKSNQLVRDVSQGMTLLKNKYKKQIPTNISTLNIKSNVIKEKFSSVHETSAKNIYLLLEDDS